MRLAEVGFMTIYYIRYKDAKDNNRMLLSAGGADV
jgi:hypothetical protein